MLKNVSISAVTVAMLALAVPYAAFGQTGNELANRTIEVQGHGEARATPDYAALDIGIETRSATAEEAASQNAELSQKVVKAIKDKLGDKGKIWTGGYNLFEEYEPHPPTEGKPKISGYRASNSISLETGTLDQLGALIDAAIGAGANRINSLSFRLRDDTNARNQAIADASKAAQAQAQALASALSVKLKRLLHASTVGEVRPIPLMRQPMAMAEAAQTPIQPGEVTVPATVSLIYEIE